MYISTIKNHIKIVCLLMIVLVTSINGTAQTTSDDGFKAPDFTPKSPEAAAFLKYGEYPVDLSTGVPGISIPIYNIKVDNIEMPISLSYHASGVKVNQEATWVGLGWNLNAGAQIILSARDGIDENDGGINDPQRDGSYVKQFMLDHPYNFSGNQLKEYVKSKVKDVYSLSSPTVNGSFYINDGSPVIFPPDAFKVEIGGDGIRISNFTITDKLGNKYLFKSTIEKSVRVFTHHDEYTSAWYVDEIITSKNNKIKFTYQDDGSVIEYSESESIGVTEEGVNCGCTYGTTTQKVGQIRKSNENTITSTKKIKEIIFNDGQTKVEFELKKGRLDLVNQNGYLESIKVSQNAVDGFNVIKKVSFDYSYFNESYVGSNAHRYKRLKLNRIFELNNSNEHRFVYSDIVPPVKDSKSEDYYGYYNGATNSDLIPKHILLAPVVRTVGTANREVNPETIQAGILKQIFYPTKGSSRFNYEPNTFYGIDQLNKYSIQTIEASIIGIGPANNPAPGQLEDPDGEHHFEGQNCISGGNCLKYKTVHKQLLKPQNSYLTYKITNSGDTSDKVIKYKYCRVMVYSDRLLFDSGKINKNREIKIPVTLVAGDCVIALETYGADMRIDAIINYSDENTMPKNIVASGLRIQSIENYDSDDKLLLKKAYEYTDKENNAISSGRLINELTTDFISSSFANFKQGICPQEGSSNTVIYKVDYTRGYYINSKSKQGIESNTIIYRYVKEVAVNLTGTENMYTQYEFTTDSDWTRADVGLQINFGWKRGKVLEKNEFKTVGKNTFIVQKEKNTYFDDNSKVAYVKGYKLDRRVFINIAENSNPKQQPVILTILMDCNVPQSLSEAYVLADYNIPIPWFYQKSSEISNYFYNASNTLTGTVVSTINYNYKNPSHLQLTSQTATNSNQEALETKYFYPQDAEMASEPFVKELIAENKVGAILTTQAFRGLTKLSEQKTIYDKSAATSNLLLPKQVLENLGTAALTIIATDKKISYDKYDDKGNLLQYTLEGAQPTAIIWGYNKTLVVAKIENIAYTSIPISLINEIVTASSNTGTEAKMSAAINKLYQDQGLANTLITGYTYKPLIGLTSMTAPTGLITFYEYDSLGRLQFVKDAQGNLLSENQYHYINQ